MEKTLVFKRYEKKYRITPSQKESLLSAVGEHLIPDRFGKSRVHSIYLDTTDFRLIRESITAGVYKEKLRLRSYGTPKDTDGVFLEIKKKYKGVVYKRREEMTLAEALDYIAGGKMPKESQIMKEIDYAMRVYGPLLPAMLISCSREAYYAADDDTVRLTFDNNLSFSPKPTGFNDKNLLPIIPEDDIILEVKTAGAVPLWLSAALSENKIFSAPFSKYATAYKNINYPHGGN
ncbi:MAG: polyphosphate polymerase domain-containing protein [Clostridia bacterium]|nr:polyphosphate polymerase domain-containing protein [Clostridia bacterium]